MKKQIIDWVIALFIHKLKVRPIILAIIASVMAALIYGINYFSAMGYPVPEWVTANDGMIGFVLGLILQGHSTAYIKPGEQSQKNPYSQN